RLRLRVGAYAWSFESYPPPLPSPTRGEGDSRSKGGGGLEKRLVSNFSRGPLASGGTALEARLGQLRRVHDPVQLLFAEAALAGQLADRPAAAERLLRHPGGLVVADHRRERGRQHQAPLDQLRSPLGRLQALDAALREVPR